MKPMWFKDNVAYTMAKYGMSMVKKLVCKWNAIIMHLAIKF